MIFFFKKREDFSSVNSTLALNKEQMLAAEKN